jgi:hypothetical protein
VIRRLLAAWLVLAILCGFTVAAPVKNPDPLDIQPIANRFMFDGVQTKIEWEECGEINAYYWREARTVTMCTELLVLKPGAIRFILAHELAHGVITQRDVPYTSHHEAAADELATLMLIWMGRADDVHAAAEFWFEQGGDEDATDDHFSGHRRWFNLECLAYGATGEPKYGRCVEKYRRATRAWVHLLGMGQ